MTRIIIESSLIVVTLVMFFGRGGAQSGCTTALMSLAPCLTYVTGSSATPSLSCCSQLGNVVSSNPRCLCTLLNGGGSSSLGVSINQTLALALPDKCKVQTPPVSQCNDSVAEGPAGGPSPPTSPVGSPVANAPKTTTSPVGSPIANPPKTATSPVGSPIANAPKTATTMTIAPISSETPASEPSSATSPTSSTTADESETPTTVSVPPIPSGTESKTIPATNGTTSSRGTTISSSSFTISMLALFLSGCASVTINA